MEPALYFLEFFFEDFFEFLLFWFFELFWGFPPPFC